MTTKVQDLFDDAAPRYNEIVAATNYLGPSWLSRQIQSLSPPKTILDLACATGNLGNILRSAYPEANITGVDISPKMIELANEGGQYDLTMVHDMNLPLSLEKRAIDLIVALGFMEFVSKPEELLTELTSLLTASGTVFLSFQEHIPDQPELGPRTTRSGDVIHHAYTRDQIVELIESSGLKCISTQREIGYTSRAGFACPYIFCKAVAN